MKTRSPRFGFAFTLCLGACLPLAAQQAAAHGGGGHGGFGDSAQIEITGSIPEMCTLTEVPDDAALGALAPDLGDELGQLAFVCNFANSQNVDVTMKSDKGALDRIGGSETVAYQASWALIAGGAYQNVSGWTGGGANFSVPSGANGVPQTGLFKIKVTGSTVGLPAGTYRDTLTFSISP